MKKLFILFIFLFARTAFAQQVSVVLSVDQANVSLEDEIHLTVSVKGAFRATEPTFPSLPAFRLINSGTSVSSFSFNGQASSESQYSYILVPLQEGAFTVGPVSVFYGGREYKSNQLTVMVARKSQSPVPSPSQQGIPLTPPQENRDYWITAEVSNLSPYVGEQILYRFKFYTAVNVGQATLDAPDFKDFWSEEVVPEKKYNQEVNGRTYSVSEIVVALVPLNSGKITLKETVLNVAVPDRMASPFRNDPFFNDPFFQGKLGRTKTKHLKADAVAITVKPLPQPVPSDFTGVVGALQLHSSLSSTQITVGDTVTLTVEFQGEGNTKDAILPDSFQFPGMKVYDDKPQTDITRRENGVFVKKTFKKALVPLQSGNFDIPSMRLSSFNPKTGRFEKVMTDAFKVAVAPSSDPHNQVAISPPLSTQAPTTQSEFELHLGPEIFEPVKEYRPSLFFVFFLAAPPVLFLMAFLWRSYSARPKDAAKGAFSDFQKNLRKIHDASDVRLLWQTVQEYMGKKFKRDGKSLTAEEIGNLLSGESQKEILSFLIDLESMSYRTLTSAFSMKNLVQKTENLIRVVDKS